MKIISTLNIDCPYCGYHNHYKLPEDAQEFSTYIFNCDFEAGGCDRQFAINLRFEFTPIIYELQQKDNKEHMK